MSRLIQACGGCAQRVQTTPITPPAQTGFPQAGYAQTQGYPPQQGYPAQQGGHRFATGALIGAGAGAAGLVGGALLSDDEPDRVVNSYYESDDFGDFE